MPVQRTFLSAATALLTFARVATAETLPDLPSPVANNAVALAQDQDATWLVSLAGLGPGKTHADVHANVSVLRLGDEAWREAPPLPDSVGRLASVAVGVGDEVLVFGGYTVAEDGGEVSTPEVWAYRPRDDRYRALAPMPVPVDDAVAVVWREMFVYLISGWHNSGNVNLVQRYDLANDRWVQATPWPGDAVFGHAGGIAGDTIVVCDGVAVEVATNERRSFADTDACYRGEIREDDPTRIDWFAMPSSPLGARYRTATVGLAGQDAIVFAGGSGNPYNFNGMGYDGEPSRASTEVVVFDLARMAWRTAESMPVATMDHRGLIVLPEGQLAVVGGMRDPQTVSNTVVTFKLLLDE